MNDFIEKKNQEQEKKEEWDFGLSIGYNIVKMHKGIIKFDRNIEKGTRMIVKIPIK